MSGCQCSPDIPSALRCPIETHLSKCNLALGLESQLTSCFRGWLRDECGRTVLYLMCNNVSVSANDPACSLHKYTPLGYLEASQSTLCIPDSYSRDSNRAISAPSELKTAMVTCSEPSLYRGTVCLSES